MGVGSSLVLSVIVLIQVQQHRDDRRPGRQLGRRSRPRGSWRRFRRVRVGRQVPRLRVRPREPLGLLGAADSSSAARLGLGRPRRHDSGGTHRSGARRRCSRRRSSVCRPSAWAHSMKIGSFERRQRLQRRVRPRAAHAGEVAVGRVEGLQHGIGHRAEAERVERRGDSGRAGRFVPDLGAVAGRRQEQEAGAGGHTLGPPTLGSSSAAGGQGDVADHLGIDAEARPAGEQAVVRIARQQFGRRPRRLTIGRRVTISRCSCLRLQPRSMNSTASQSSSSGCDGGSLCMPEVFARRDQAVPKYACQTRLTSDRAVVGELRSTSQRANVSRVVGAPGGSGCRKAARRRRPPCPA